MSAPVNLPAPDPLAGLNAQYRTAVQNEAAAALDKVRLDDIPHLQRELQRLENNEPLPETDEPGIPDSLKRLRDNYRQQRAVLIK
jgi:hypothetical protein